MKYRAEIDGLRALAVVPVILFHAGLEWFSGGFVGVDVFFVISGYLITTILIGEIESNNFSILRFYERRARRILPVLFLVMAACIPFAWMWMLPDQMNSFAKSLAAVSLFYSNVLFWKESGYFSAVADEKPLLHTWSLAVEEQYYLFFPVFLILFWRFGRQRVFWLIVLMAFASLLWSEWGWRNSPVANFYLPFSRVWEIFAGSVAAFVISKQGIRPDNVRSSIGLLAVLLAISLYDEQTPFPGLLSLLPVGGTVLLILYAGKGTYAARLLAWKGFVGIGLISYSAYLWHQPLFAYARIALHEKPSQTLMLSLALLSVLLAWASWKYVENPFRNRAFISPRSVAYASVFGLLTFLTLGKIGDHFNGFEHRFETPKFVQDGEFSMPMRWSGYCFYNFNDRKLSVGEDGYHCSMGSENQSLPSVLIFGDSYAAHWEPYFKSFAQDFPMRLESVTTNWCFPDLYNGSTAKPGHISRQQCEMNRQWLKDNYQNYDVVIFSAAWHQVGKFGYVDEVVRSFKELASDADDTRFIVIDVPLQFERGSVEDAIYDKKFRLIPKAETMAAAERSWHEVENSLSGYKDFIFLDKQEMGFRKNKDLKNDEGYPYSLDGGHISVYGAKSLYQESRGQDIIRVLSEYIFRDSLVAR